MTRFLARPEGRIAYDLLGEGPLVVLAPGMGDLRGAWRFVAPALVQAGWRVAVVDLRGHGESDATFGRYTPEDVAADLLALVDELGGPAVFVAHSASAAAAVKAAGDAPEKVTGLVLVGPVVRDPGVSNATMNALVRALFLPPWGAWAWGMYYRSIFKAGRPPDHDAHVRAVVAALAQPARRRAMLGVGMSPKGACASRVDAVRAPVLALVGEKDPDFDAAAEAAWLEEALRADVRLLPGVGHYPHMEVPEATVAAILPFLRGVACPAA